MDFPEVEDCSGTGTPSMSFTAGYELGTFRASTRISGATDAVITPSIDFGCGVANPAYTSLLFDASCTSFQPAEGTPGCTPETAPTSIGWLVFVKQ